MISAYGSYVSLSCVQYREVSVFSEFEKRQRDDD